MSWGNSFVGTFVQFENDKLIVTPITADEFYKSDDTMPDKMVLVFECFECKIELNVGTTSFRTLCEQAKEKDWKLKWLDMGYETYCPQCKAGHA
jgi:hypothetical protein